MSREWDVVVVGAGAAGLLAAVRSAERGRRTLLLEKNRKAGVKILMSGGTRCNLTHATDARGIVDAFGPPGRFLHSALSALGPQDLVDLIEAEGVPTKVESGGKIFPVSNKATDVLGALLRRLGRSGCTLACQEPLLALKRNGDGFDLTTSGRTLTAEKVIVTTGGRSYPGSGTTGDGYAWLERMGHTIVPPRPALVPVTANVPWVHSLRGVTVGDVGVHVRDAEGAPLDEDRGSFLFTHFGLSGPVTMNVSRAITGHPQPATLILDCNFLPGMREKDLDERLRTEAHEPGRARLEDLIAAELPARLLERLIVLAGLDPKSPAASLSKEGRHCLVQTIQSQRIPVAGTMGFARAEVTAGGVRLDEVDSRTMQSKRVPNLYLAGEILDLDGPIGGYNFQAAFSTGQLAGERV